MIILSDEWKLNGKTCRVIDLEPVPGSTQCLVEVEGEIITICRHDLKV